MTHSLLIMKYGSVILAFYNDLLLLRLALDSLEKQFEKEKNFEVIIADDGSRSEVVSELKTLLPLYSFEVLHIWQPDRGFQKTVILNKAILAAKSDSLIFLDADCIPQDHFVRDHLYGLTPGVCQAGRRVDVFYRALDKLKGTDSSRFFSKHWLRFIAWSMQGMSRNVERGIRLPQFIATKFRSKTWSVVGCNFSVCRQDLVAVNGFDERANVPWGAEDADIERRLLKAGLTLKSLRYQATVVHFDASYEKRGPVTKSDQDRLEIFLTAKAENRSWTPYGIVKEDRPDPVLYRSA